MLTAGQIDGVINDILQQEGGYVDDPKDPGGATNYGITQTTADDYNLGPVKDLTAAHAVEFYRQWFAEFKLDAIPDENTFGLAADCAVNHDPTYAIKWLQAAFGLEADGDIGPQTLAALSASHVDWRGIYAHVLAQRIEFYGHIVSNTPSQVRFINGWLIRACTFLYPAPMWE